MKTIQITESWQNKIALIIACIVSLLLFYIDEGYYNFNYLKDPGNYVALVFYVSGTWFGQYVVSKLFFKRQFGFDKTVLNAFLGVPLGLTLTILFFLLLQKLQGF